MSREVHRMPLDWQHPMEWGERWDGDGVRMQLVPRPLWTDFAGSLASWEREGRDIEARTGFGWEFWSEYCLTGYQGHLGVEVRGSPAVNLAPTLNHWGDAPDWHEPGVLAAELQWVL